MKNIIHLNVYLIWIVQYHANIVDIKSVLKLACQLMVIFYKCFNLIYLINNNYSKIGCKLGRPTNIAKNIRIDNAYNKSSEKRKYSLEEDNQRDSKRSRKDDNYSNYELNHLERYTNEINNEFKIDTKDLELLAPTYFSFDGFTSDYSNENSSSSFDYSNQSSISNYNLNSIEFDFNIKVQEGFLNFPYSIYPTLTEQAQYY